MDKQEFDALIKNVEEAVRPAIKQELGEAAKGLLTPEQLETSLKLYGLDKDVVKTLTDAVEKQGEKITELINSQKKTERPETLKSKIIRLFPDIQKAVADAGGKYKFTVNRNEIVGKTAVSLTSITSDPIGMDLPDFAVVQSQNNAIAPSLNSFVLAPDDHGVIYWTDMTTRTNNAAARSDGSAAAEQVYAWTGYSETVDNISAMVPAHKEALKHISVMENLIKSLLTDDCAVALDGYCYTGTGTAPQIGGIYTRATAFNGATYIAAGGYAPTGAGLYDLIACMGAQIMKATKYNVNKVWLNPYDVLRLRLAKDDNGNFLFPQYVLGNGAPLYVGNIQVVEANSVTVNTLVLGDSTKATLYTGGTEIEIGYDLTGDFSKRIVTILANMEASLVIRNAEVDAFLKSTDIGADISAITTVLG